VDLSGWVGVGLGENCDCTCGILMLLCWGGGFCGIGYSDIFSLFFGNFVALGGGWSASRVLLCACA